MEGLPDPQHLSEQALNDLTFFRVSAIVEYLAARLDCDDGHTQMIFWLEGGVPGHSELGHRRITRNELNVLPRSRR